MDNSPILLMTTPFDDPYIGSLRPLFHNRRALQISANPANYHEISLYAKSKGCKYVVSTNPVVLNKVVDSGRNESIDSWQGSLFERDGLTYLFLNPLKQLYSVPYGRFIAERFLSKILSPSKWPKTPPFSWEPARSDTIEQWYRVFATSILIACDIETVSYDEFPDNPLQGERKTLIRSVAYTGLWDDGNIHTIVIPIADAPESEQLFWVAWMRKFNLLPQPKVFQNGLYDSFHFVVYNAPVRNYAFDTQSLFHSWYCELPKDLAFIAAFTVHNIFYWKDMAKEGNLYRQWEYNGRDGWSTLVSILNIIKEAPEYVWRNNELKFPLWVPCLSCNLEGIKIDQEQRAVLTALNKQKHLLAELRLQKWFGEGFNPRSPQQVVKLIAFYGCSDITSSGEAELRKFGLRHPLNQRFASEIIRSREVGKLISTYLKPHDYSISESATKSRKKKSPLLHRGRVYFSLNPDGTDNARLAAREGSNWTGMQIQNQPTEEDSIKSMLVADEGNELFELDNERSETYTTGYLSGDENLLETIRQDREEGKDFHIVNAMKFFGLKYDEVTKELRDKVSKRVNHGANYNMGAAVLLATMGEANVDKAKRLLGLPAWYTRIQVCEHLLECFDKAYPGIKGAFYEYIKACVESTRKLVSPLGWTRYCFGHPRKNKPDLNALVAHAPSNLSVGIVNEAFKDVYWKIQAKNPKVFRLKAQIHDSIFGQVKLGNRHLVLEARKLCIRTVSVTDCKGIVRDMTIPVALKFGKDWGHMEKYKDG